MKTLATLMLGLLMAFTASAQQLFISSSPDTVIFGDSSCVWINNHYAGSTTLQYRNWGSGSGILTDTLSYGGHKVCLTNNYPCESEEIWYFEWYDSTGLFLGDTTIVIYSQLPYTISNDTIGATNWSFDVITSRTVRVYLYPTNMSTTAIDSAVVFSPGVNVLSTSLVPTQTYFRWIYIQDFHGDWYRTCNVQYITTAACGVATLSSFLIVNGGTALELTLQFPTWSVGSIIWVNGTPVTLVQTGMSGQWATMTLAIPYAEIVTITSPCGDIYSYNTLATSIDQASSQLIKVTSESISTEDQNAMIELWSMSGQLLESGNDKVEIRGLSAGIYLYRIYDAEGNFLSTGKFAKTN